MKNTLYSIALLVAAFIVSCTPQTPEPELPDDTQQADSTQKADTTQTPEINYNDGYAHYRMVTTDSLFCNPERGFHRYYDIYKPVQEGLTASRVKTIYNNGYTLIHTNYYLKEYRDTLIDESYLEAVRQNMLALREGGCKCIIRFAYTSSEREAPREAPEDLVLQHIAQIKPILQEFADVIFVMEAGFVGVWGEWYYTSDDFSGFKQNPVKDEEYVSRRHVLDALLDAMPQERMICVRTPKFKMRCYNWGLADTLTRAEAYTGTPKARLACHDDAFMADNSDLGTFNTTEQRAYWEAETRYLIYGGESCPPGNVASCDRSMDQMMKMHISYLNNDYYRGTINKWYANGCLDNIRRYMGYRLEGRDVATTMNPKAGEDLYVRLSLVNVGYSAPKNPRDIEMLLINTADPTDYYRVVPDTDPRFWFTDQMQQVEATFQPAKAGEYKLCLYMPDPQPTLHDDPRYAIRLANDNCWDETTGYNCLATINIE